MQKDEKVLMIPYGCDWYDACCTVFEVQGIGKKFY